MYKLRLKVYKYEELSRKSRLVALKYSRQKFVRKGPIYSEELFKNDYEWMIDSDYIPLFLEDGTYLNFPQGKVYVDIEKMELVDEKEEECI